MENVSTADPAVSQAPWFVVPETHRAFVEIFAMLLTATAGNLRIAVRTTGQGIPECNGFAGVDILGFE